MLSMLLICKLPVVFYPHLGYNKCNLECAIISCYFEPTDTLNGIPTLPYRCQASGLYALCSGRQKYGCGYPPSFARSQNTRFGISGNTKEKAVVISGCFCFENVPK